jgi:hypothetical protein
MARVEVPLILLVDEREDGLAVEGVDRRYPPPVVERRRIVVPVRRHDRGARMRQMIEVASDHAPVDVVGEDELYAAVGAAKCTRR